GPLRDAESDSDVRDGQVAVVAKRDHDLVVGREARDRGADDIAVLGVDGVVAGGKGGLDGDVGRGSPRPAQSVAAGVDEDPVEPRLEAGLIAEGLPLSPRLDE